MRFFFLTLAALALSPTAVWCDPPATEPPATSSKQAPAEEQKRLPDVRVEVQVIAVPEPIAIALVPDMKSKDKIEAANARLQEMLAKGTAKLIGWPIVTTHSGQRAVVEAIKEIRFATEYAPPTVNVASNVPADPAPKVIPSIDATTFEGFPSAFETRNAGVTLEVEPVVSADGKSIDVNLVPQHVRLKGYHKVTLEGAAHKGKVVVEQPEFHTNKITTSLSLKNGERVLMGVYPIDDPPKHLEIFLLKVELVPVE